MEEIEVYKRALERERKAHERAEDILEEKTRSLFLLQEALQQKYDEAKGYLGESQLLLSLSELAQKGLSTSNILDFVIHEICQLKNWPIGHAYLLKQDENTQELKLISSDIWYISDRQKYQRVKEVSKNFDFKAGAGLPGRVYQSRQPIWIEDIYTDDNFPRAKQLAGVDIKGAFGVPILCYDDVIAVIEFFSPSNIPQDKNMIDFVITTANQLRTMLERQRNEDEILKSYQELKRVHQDLKNAQLQLMQQSKLASIGLLAAGVAHEINNPLAFVNSNIEVLQQNLLVFNSMLFEAKELIGKTTGSASDTQVWQAKWEQKAISFTLEDSSTLLEETMMGLGRVADIVRDLKTFSHLDESEIQHADINQCIDLTVTMLPKEAKNNCHIIKEYGVLPQLICYPGRINQVLMNMLMNACQAMQGKAELHISTRLDNDEIVIQIGDTGEGIKAEHLDKIFDPFFTTKPVGVGTGLGLSISYSIIQNHGGRITVESELGKGTVFTIYLPLHYFEQKTKAHL